MNKVYLTKTGTFTASHSHEGRLAEQSHSHHFRYEVTLYGPINEEGYLLDFRELEQMLEIIVHPLKNQDLSTLFKNPTTENICIWLYNQINKRLPNVHHVKLAEEQDRWVIYEGDK